MGYRLDAFQKLTQILIKKGIVTELELKTEELDEFFNQKVKKDEIVL